MDRRTRPEVSPGRRGRHKAAPAVLMIRPTAFGRNEVTLPTNAFQSTAADPNPEETNARARQEFDRCALILERSGIEVHVFSGRSTTHLPDEIFPNNWLSTHPDGTMVVYPLMAWNRRNERRPDVLEQLQRQKNGFRIDRLVDLTHLERSNRFLEGTGSLVFDHGNRLAYACLSPRTHVEALREFGRATGYGIISFGGVDTRGRAIYHTNVMMSIGEGFALVCLEAISAAVERLRVLTRLERSGRELIEIEPAQLESFCGNVIQLRSGERRLILMSTRARAAFSKRQLDALQGHGRIVSINLDTIERHGGGSIRCMLAELFLPRKTPFAGTPGPG